MYFITLSVLGAYIIGKTKQHDRCCNAIVIFIFVVRSKIMTFNVWIVGKYIGTYLGKHFLHAFYIHVT